MDLLGGGTGSGRKQTIGAGRDRTCLAVEDNLAGRPRFAVTVHPSFAFLPHRVKEKGARLRGLRGSPDYANVIRRRDTL